MVFKVFDHYTNYNAFVHRVKPYNPAGRFQTESESNDVCQEMLNFLDKFGITCLHINGDFAGYDYLIKLVLKDLGVTNAPIIQSATSQEDNQIIKVRYLSDKIPPMEYVDGKSDWIDLRTAESFDLKAGEFKLIPLGVAMQLPHGYEAHIIPRSSTFKNYGVIQANHMGLVDESYCGDNDQWLFPALAMRDTHIEVGDRICQFRIEKHQPKLVFETVDTLGNADRGGIGSTGTR